MLRFCVLLLYILHRPLQETCHDALFLNWRPRWDGREKVTVLQRESSCTNLQGREPVTGFFAPFPARREWRRMTRTRSGLLQMLQLLGRGRLVQCISCLKGFNRPRFDSVCTVYAAFSSLAAAFFFNGGKLRQNVRKTDMLLFILLKYCSSDNSEGKILMSELACLWD